MARRKLRIAKWEKEYEKAWYRRLHSLFSHDPEKLSRKYAELEKKQKEALAKGKKEKAREYGRKKMKLKLESKQAYDKIMQETEEIKANVFLGMMEINNVLKDKELDEITERFMAAVREHEKAGSEEFDRKIDQLLSEWGRKVQEVIEQKGRSIK